MTHKPESPAPTPVDAKRSAGEPMHVDEQVKVLFATPSSYQ